MIPDIITAPGGGADPLLFVGTSSIDVNATQQKLYFLAAELARRGRRVAACVPDFPENRAFFEKRGQGVEAIYTPRSGPLAEVRRKHGLIGARKWAAVHVIGVGVRTLLRHRRRVGTAPLLHDFDENLTSIGGLRPWHRLYLRWVEAQMMSRAAGFSCASEYLVDWVRGQRPELGPEILYSPVAISADEHVVRPELSRSVRERFAGRHVLVYVGTISRIYQIGEILDLAAALKGRRDDFTVLICGDGVDRAAYQDESVRRGLGGVVHFEGRISRTDVASYLDAASVLLFPFHDTRHNRARCPTKGFHYAAANRPLVTNRVGEVARVFGDTAFYYAEKDVRAMADACGLALRASPGFNSGIPFYRLTWEERADRYESWFGRMKIW